MKVHASTVLPPFWGRHGFISKCICMSRSESHAYILGSVFGAPRFLNMVVVCNATQGYHACSVYHEAIFMPHVPFHAHSCTVFEHNFGQIESRSMLVTSPQLLQSGEQIKLKPQVSRQEKLFIHIYISVFIEGFQLRSNPSPLQQTFSIFAGDATDYDLSL